MGANQLEKRYDNRATLFKFPPLRHVRTGSRCAIHPGLDSPAAGDRDIAHCGTGT